MKLSLIAMPPFGLEGALAYLRASPLAVLEEISGETYSRALTIGGRDLLPSLRQLVAGEAPELEVRIEGDGIDATTVNQAVARVRAIFSLDGDPAHFRAVAALDPILDAVSRDFPGLRPVLIADPYEALVRAIVGQQINTTFARTLMLALIALGGRQLRIGDRPYRLMPAPEVVASLDPDILRAHQFSRQKIAYLLNVSDAIASGALDLEGLRDVPHEMAMATLTRYKGIGRWTAEYVLMRVFGAADIIPAGGCNTPLRQTRTIVKARRAARYLNRIGTEPRATCSLTSYCMISYYLGREASCPDREAPPSLLDMRCSDF